MSISHSADAVSSHTTHHPSARTIPSDGTLWSFCTILLVAMIPLTVHPSHRCAVARANRLTPDSLLARTCVHGAGPSRCRVANRPFSSMRYGDRLGWGGAWYVPCKTPRQQRQGRRMPPQDDLPSRAVRHDGRHG